MRILITGASGYLGARLYQDLSKKFETYGTYHTSSLFPNLLKMELTKENEVHDVVSKVAPDIIVHAAAIPTAQRAKEDKQLTFDVNTSGTQRVVDAAAENNSKIIFISTGAADLPNEPYGFSKKEAETIVSSSKNGYLIIKPSLIIGQSPNTTNDRFQNRLLKNIADVAPARYENSALFRVTWIGHISEVIESAVRNKISNEIIPVLAEDKKTRFRIASDILNRFDIECVPFVEQGTPSVFISTTEKLKKLNLKLYSYSEIIEKTVSEIQDYLGRKQPSVKLITP